MTGRLENLLTQEEPLDQSEIADLLDWLRAMREDVATFGATSEDLARISQIRIKLQASQAI